MLMAAIQPHDYSCELARIALNGDAPSEAESLGAIGSRVSQAVELFSQAIVLSLERFDALMQRRDQNLDFINRVFWRDVL